MENPPAVANGIVYVGSNDGNLYALDALNGTLKWSFPSGSINIFIAPTVANGILFYVAYSNYLYALDATTGAQKWNSYFGFAESSPTISDGTVYFATEEPGFYALSLP